jgi:hypothetical protein
MSFDISAVSLQPKYSEPNRPIYPEPGCRSSTNGRRPITTLSYGPGGVNGSFYEINDFNKFNDIYDSYDFKGQRKMADFRRMPTVHTWYPQNANYFDFETSTNTEFIISLAHGT